ncbi:hypothetical protein BDD12DRAFT_805695 [Trichophaea hybrida]|nr:hypothetical protein BDD12DRAFT_805695 [Trichophaea hybrida]
MTEVVTDATTRHHLLRFISLQQNEEKEKIEDFQGLLNTISDNIFRNGQYDATDGILHSKNVNIDSDDLFSNAATIDHGLEVESSNMHVVHLYGEITFWQVYIEVTQPANSEMPESASQLVRVVKVSSGGAYAVISAGYIVGAAHIIPEEPISSKLENTEVIFPSHIDLAICNDIYYILGDVLNSAAKRV